MTVLEWLLLASLSMMVLVALGAAYVAGKRQDRQPNLAVDPGVRLALHRIGLKRRVYMTKREIDRNVATARRSFDRR